MTPQPIYLHCFLKPSLIIDYNSMMTLKFFVIVVLSIISGGSTKDLWKVTNLRAVIGVNSGIMVFHNELNLASSGLDPPLEDSDGTTHLKLCQEIFTSTYFQEDGLKLIDMESSSDQQLLLENDSLFHLIMKKSGDRYKYHNPYIKLDSGAHLFICPVRKPRPKEIVPYYIGREHNFNVVPGGSPIAGRFVFTERFILEALAEEPAIESVVKYKTEIISEYIYMKRRQFDIQRGRSENKDPVCQLRPIYRLCVCVSIFASDSLRDRYKFIPMMENVGMECKEARISFLALSQSRFIASIKWRFFDKRRTYQEQLMACKAVRRENNEPVTIYVSQGYAKNTVFTFEEKYDDGRIFVQQYFRNVNVVDGIGDGVEEAQVEGNTEEDMKDIEEITDDHGRDGEETSA